jgi:hypothetical protein
MLRRVALVRTDVSEEPSASFIMVTRIGELGTTLAATSNRRTLRRNIFQGFEVFILWYGPLSEEYSGSVFRVYFTDIVFIPNVDTLLPHYTV